MKKKTFIIIESLTAAGAEKSLISFLSVLDYQRFDVDLQLFRYGGELERYLPETVNLLPPFKYTSFLAKSLFRQIISLNFRNNWSRIKYSLSLRIKKNLTHADRARLYWKCVSPLLPDVGGYDIAIAYSQGLPTFYVASKVDAKIKFSWVNVSYRLSEVNRTFQKTFYSTIDRIITVSDSSLEVFKTVFPEFSDKMCIIRDMLVGSQIMKMSEQQPEKKIDLLHPVIMTVARLNKPQKGYDIALEACRILRDRGTDFHWYAIGKGPYKEEMESFIEQNSLKDRFFLLGTTSNPYPYISRSTIYVQTSRHEGYGLSIAEARILNIPVVTTEFDAVYAQMKPGFNGLVVPQDPVAVADAIEKLLSNNKLYTSIVEFLKTERKGNPEEIQKFYQLIDF